MKYLIPFFLFFLCAGCTEKAIELNDIQTTFDAFPLVDSLEFASISDDLLEEPSKMLVYGDNLIIQVFGKSKNTHFVVFSLKEGRVINETIKRGDGPDEMLACEMSLLNDKLWLYDMSKKRIGSAPIDSFLLTTPGITWYKLNHSYYRTAVLTDSIMLGTNDFESKSKINFANLITGQIEGRGSYSHLDDNVGLPALIDACSCYIDVNPTTKEILLSYRYTDVIEIYDSKGNLKCALQGPECFDVEFRSNEMSMGKTVDTRKAFVNSYVTDKYIYLLYSGCKRTEKNWANGTEIFVFSWDGQPQKKYLLPQPIYALAVDESKQIIYSYSMQTEELLKATM